MDAPALNGKSTLGAGVGKSTDPAKIAAVTSAQSEFGMSVRALAQHVDRRLKAIKDRAELAGQAREATRQIVAKVVVPDIDSLLTRAGSVDALAETRPSMFVMGKLKQGKTSLLRRWLGVSDGHPGCDELRHLPTGTIDTTAALIRLTDAASVPECSRSRLRVTFLQPTDDSEKDVGPIPDGRPEFRRVEIAKQPAVADPAISPEVPYNVCRFPLPHDAGFRLADRDGVMHVGREGSYTLESFQWYSSEVRIPVSFDGSQPSHAASILKVLDIVDAPGAGAAAVIGFPKFKQRKNTRVFRAGVDMLDVMLLVASLDIAGVHLGGEFQADVWWPWCERCDGNSQGRLLLAFTHTAELFKQARNRIAPGGGHSGVNDDSNFYSFIAKNVLSPLMVRNNGKVSPIGEDPTSWPPMFFFESNEDALLAALTPDGKRGGPTEPSLLQPGSARAVYQRLRDHLGAPRRDHNLTFAEQLILEIVSDWDDSALSPDKRRGIKEWLVWSLCCLLDPADRGFVALTEFVVSYASGGPVATNHLEERLRESKQLADDFRNLLLRLQRPEACADALVNLKSVRSILAEFHRNSPRGVAFKLGEACRRRREQAEKNARPLLQERCDFGSAEICTDVVKDALPEIGIKDQDADLVCDAVVTCLLHDPVIARLLQRGGQVITQASQPLSTLQTVAAERVARVISYLATADDDQLRSVAHHCYERNMDEADVMEALRESQLLSWNQDDQLVAEAVEASARRLGELITSAGFRHAYQTD